MGNASGREEDAAAMMGDGADEEDGGGDSSVRSSERGFPAYGSGGANHVRRACSVGVVGGGGGGAGSPPGSPGRSLSPRMFVPQVRSRDPASLYWSACSVRLIQGSISCACFAREVVGVVWSCPCLVCWVGLGSNATEWSPCGWSLDLFSRCTRAVSSSYLQASHFVV